MSLLVTTQSYPNDGATEFGLLIELDNHTGEILRKKRIETPIQTTNNLNERIKPGLRGLYIYNYEIYVASWNTLFILDIESLDIKRSFTHKWMSDLHGIYVDAEGVWLTSSLPDAVILYDFDGNPRASMWLPETFLYKERAKVDKEMDWSQRGKEFRGFHDYHANHIEVRGDTVYVIGRSNINGRVCRFNKDLFINKGTITDKDIDLFIKNLYGPHDGTWVDGNFFLTETLSSTMTQINPAGKVDFRIKVKVDENEVDPRKIPPLKQLRKVVANTIKGRPTLDKTTYWTRGLAVTDDFFYVGQSTWAGEGEEESRARVVKIDRKSHEILDAFYLEIDGYPETRIFQVLDVETILAKQTIVRETRT